MLIVGVCGICCCGWGVNDDCGVGIGGRQGSGDNSMDYGVVSNDMRSWARTVHVPCLSSTATSSCMLKVASTSRSSLLLRPAGLICSVEAVLVLSAVPDPILVPVLVPISGAFLFTPAVWPEMTDFAGNGLYSLSALSAVVVLIAAWDDWEPVGCGKASR